MQTKTSPSSPKRMDSGDLPSYISFLKFIAITLIFSYHLLHYRHHMPAFTSFYAPFTAHSYFLNEGLTGIIKGIFFLFIYYGNVGVELFVIASGFGLYSSHLKRPIKIGPFYIRRAMRLLPLYWVAILLLIYIAKVSMTKSETLQHIFAVQALSSAYNANIPLWFISLMAVLYAIAPLLVKLPPKPYFFYPAIIISFALTPALSGLFKVVEFDYQGIYLSKYIPHFLLGMMLAHLNELNIKVFSLRAFIISTPLLLLVLLAIVLEERFVSGHIFIMLTLSMLFSLYGLFIAINKSPVLKWLINKIAYASYAIYLFHFWAIFYIAHLFVKYELTRYIRTHTGRVYFESDSGVICMGILAYMLIFLLAWAVQRTYDALIAKAFPSLGYARYNLRTK